jgi:hypothetical protein
MPAAMIEYIFFDAALRDKFVNYAKHHDVPCAAIEDSMGLVVEVSEDIPEDISDKLEEFYEALEDEQANLSRAEGELKRLAGFGFKLPNGEARMLPLSPGMANRLLTHFTLEEIQELLNSVARYALEPPNEHLCQILATQDQNED